MGGFCAINPTVGLIQNIIKSFSADDVQDFPVIKGVDG